MPALRKNEPLWTSINPVPAQYPWLSHNETAQVCIIGGGITGAMAAYRFASAGVNTVLVTSHPLGYSGTSTACPSVRYDAGESITELAKKIGIRTAIETYHICAEALDSLEKLVEELDTDVGFARRDSLVYTDSEEEADCIYDEYLLRKQNGFDVEFINRDIASNVFSFDIAAAILSKNLAADVDPYRLTHALASKAIEKGARIYENTRITQVDNRAGESILSSDTRHTINTQTLILTTGNECGEFIKAPTPSKTGFAAVSQRLDDFAGWPGRCSISMWSKPNITISSTPDSRIFASGLDTGVIDKQGRMYGILPVRRIPERKYDELESAARYLFPQIPFAKAEYAFAGSYCETEDGLPIVGEESEYQNCYFAVCPGNNSTLYSEIAGRILLSMYEEEPLTELNAFSYDRLDRGNS
ncbi:MAG: FAD-binding oxidoreductase [Oscillospiraceae bacterium]|nr:FAD-binding oxidoreductase [Oscillospiraceae bacterium]